jgi:hypothetical protein
MHARLAQLTEVLVEIGLIRTQHRLVCRSYQFGTSAGRPKSAPAI